MHNFIFMTSTLHSENMIVYNFFQHNWNLKQNEKRLLCLLCLMVFQNYLLGIM